MIRLKKNEDKNVYLAEDEEVEEKVMVETKEVKFVFDHDINSGERHTDIIELQKRLKAEGFFEYPTFTDFFGDVTKKALIDYQLAHKVISKPTDAGAGRLGPGTRRALNA